MLKPQGNNGSELIACFFGAIADLSLIRGAVTTAWPTQWLRMEERPPIWRVAANILNKRWRKTYKGWPSSLRVWCHYRVAHSLVADGGTASSMEGVALNILN